MWVPESVCYRVGYWAAYAAEKSKLSHLFSFKKFKEYDVDSEPVEIIDEHDKQHTRDKQDTKTPQWLVPGQVDADLAEPPHPVGHGGHHAGSSPHCLGVRRLLQVKGYTAPPVFIFPLLK